MRIVFAMAAAAALAALSASPARVGAADFASGFTEKTVQVGATTWHYRIGGTGSPVLLLHGYGDTGDMWAPLAPILARRTASSCRICPASDCHVRPPGRQRTTWRRRLVRCTS